MISRPGAWHSHRRQRPGGPATRSAPPSQAVLDGHTALLVGPQALNSPPASDLGGLKLSKWARVPPKLRIMLVRLGVVFIYFKPKKSGVASWGLGCTGSTQASREHKTGANARGFDRAYMYTHSKRSLCMPCVMLERPIRFLLQVRQGHQPSLDAHEGRARRAARGVPLIAHDGIRPGIGSLWHVGRC